MPAVSVSRSVLALLWAAWFVLAGGGGRVRSAPGDRVADRGTRVWADLATSASLLGALAAARAVPGATIRCNPRRTVALGALLEGSGILLRRWAVWTLGPFFTQSVAIRPGHRVVGSGPYRYVRHPGYAGLLVSEVGLGLTLRNWASVLALVVGFLAAHLPRIRVEERVLAASLGEAYTAYAASRRRLVPGVW